MLTCGNYCRKNQDLHKKEMEPTPRIVESAKNAGAFECPECKERFVPDMKAYVMGPHTITKRKLKCPKCGAHRYCKHVLTK